MKTFLLKYILILALFVLTGCAGIKELPLPENYKNNLPKAVMIDVPLINQHDNYSCATTSLAMVMSHYDKKNYFKSEVWGNSGASIYEATKVCGNDMYALMKAAKYYGFKKYEFVSPLKIEELKYLLSQNIPVVVNIKTTRCTTCYHAIVITGYDEENVYINDPSGGYRTDMKLDKFVSIWKAHLCTPRKDIFTKSAFVLYKDK